MKTKLKKLSLIVLSLFCIFALTGCEDQHIEETIIETVVVSCEKGDFHPNQAYMTMANTALARNDFNKYTYYRNLANAMGKYDYNITVVIDGKTIEFTRYDEFNVGDAISVKKVDYYSGNKLERTEYR